MGGFDRFKDKADDYAEQARSARGGEQGKPAEPRHSEQAERGMPQERPERRSEFDGQPSRRMGQESNEDQDDRA
jgi:hypothetical protein